MKQTTTQTATEGREADVRAMTGVDSAEHRTRGNAGVSGPKTGTPQLGQPKFNWSAQNKNGELKNFEMVARNIFMRK